MYYNDFMKSKIVPVIFFLVVVALGGYFYYSKFMQVLPEKDSASRAKIVNPKNQGEVQAVADSGNGVYETETFTSLVPLLTTETLISSMTIDFNNDTFDDQIVVIRKAGSSELILLVGLYNESKSSYQRFATISTGISSTGSFSYTNMDVTGDHQRELVFQGTTDSGNYIMQIYSCENKNDNDNLLLIGDFSSDGTIFIQQVDRTEAYELSMARGEAYSIWVYSSDKNSDDPSKNQMANQIQTEYRYNFAGKKYDYFQTITVTASNLAAKELSRIQDGTVETFAAFLNGLWYKTSTTDGSVRYLYFNYPEREVIFLNGDTEESYVWEDSKIRHNGIYFTASNSIINSYQRRFTITLSTVDEIRISIVDDVNMDIKERTLWDGQYKKTEQYDSVVVTEEKRSLPDYLKGKTYMTGDEQHKVTFDSCTYVVESEDSLEEGVYAFSVIQDDDVIQFRPSKGFSFFSTVYKAKFGTKVITETVKKNTIEKVVEDRDTLILTPVLLTPLELYETEALPLQLKRQL